MVENPQWTEAARRLTDLEERQRMLLFERTPLHPAVQEIAMRISDVRRKWPIFQPRSPSLTALPACPARVDCQLWNWRRPIEAASQASETAPVRFSRRWRRRKKAQAARNSELQVDLHPAEALPGPAKVKPSIIALLETALAAGVTSVVGLGMISFGALWHRPFPASANCKGCCPCRYLASFRRQSAGPRPAGRPWHAVLPDMVQCYWAC